MNHFAVAAPIVHHTEVPPTSISNALGGAAILGVLAIMLLAGCSAGGLRPKETGRSKLGTSNTIYPIR